MTAFAQEDENTTSKYKAAIGFGLEMNMNSPENFAGGLLLNFDYNLPVPVFSFAVGANVTVSHNFKGITVLEISGMFRWYITGMGEGWFAQANVGYNYSGIEGAPLSVIAEARGGIRLPMGNFYIEPYGRLGYPVVWGAGIVGGIRLPMSRDKILRIEDELQTNEELVIGTEPLTGEALAENIIAIFIEHGLLDTSVEVTDAGIMISLLNIQFAADSSVLRESERWKIQEIANVLRRIPDVRVQVSGHAAQAGTAANTLRLSRERAENIASFLVVLEAVKPENITTVGYGATRPIASNNTPEGMAANRRIEITILEN